ncbi:transglutaminase [Pigmentiphaga sp. NML080357]|uniref:transglutaminase family protein n=1 Tax=Pigmentiphaga sp. NML080357 TaxID=2008675 RepID=UPI000B407BD9|nr:transglutaminase family protein [Pigmentiphaga sp. NML080357]OVZ57612.1 transglutaminase [Pigmentiphaga sp. NML080357]
MRLFIHHETTYRYDVPVHYSIQQLRLVPGSGSAQVVVHWDLNAPGKLDAATDAYGNTVQTLVMTRPLSEMRFVVRGEVETTLLREGRLQEGPGRIPLEHFTCPTRLTEADDAVRELAQATGPLNRPAALVDLARHIQERVAYGSGITQVTSTAAEALALGQGVCQDHSHLLIACCRALGVPARYVSGYIDPGDVPHAASHAWVDVWLDDAGWVSVDVTHGRYASGPYCRVAVGADYGSAAPVRGMRVGGGAEAMTVDVKVGATGQ